MELKKYERVVREKQQHVVVYYCRQYRSAYDPFNWEEDEAYEDLMKNPPGYIPRNSEWIKGHYETCWSWSYEK